jgi:hypothetical protein
MPSHPDAAAHKGETMIITRADRRLRRFSARVVTVCCLLLGASAPALAATRTPKVVPVPVGPTETTPLVVDTPVIGEFPNMPLALHWVQDFKPGKPGKPRPAYVATTRWLICFYEQGATHDCAQRTGLVYSVDLPASSVPRHEARPLTFWESWTGKRAPRYDYDYTVTLPREAHAKHLAWQVGACSRTTADSCAFSGERRYAYTARDLAISRVDDQLNGSNGINVVVNVRNDGRTSDETFTLETQVWEVVLAEDSNRPLISLSPADLATAGVRDTDLVITKSGLEVPLRTYLDRNLPTADVLGIHKAGMTAVRWVRTVQDLPPGPVAPEPLVPGTCPRDSAGDDTCGTHIIKYTPCEADWCGLSATVRPSVFVLTAQVNRGQLLWDFDPADNAGYKNSHYIHE